MNGLYGHTPDQPAFHYVRPHRPQVNMNTPPFSSFWEAPASWKISLAPWSLRRSFPGVKIARDPEISGTGDVREPEISGSRRFPCAGDLWEPEISRSHESAHQSICRMGGNPSG